MTTPSATGSAETPAGRGEPAAGEEPRGPRRRRWLRVALVALALVAVLLAVNTWLVERETKPARADVGRIVDLPGGDLQVRVDGPPDGRTLVLLHGWTGSMKWWDRAVPVLAKRYRIVRVDSLGHGGSAKPRDGYEVERQADGISRALASVGVTRATVVGHSMGGSLATALAEQHPRLVERLMLIGTSPSTGRHISFGDRLVVTPVVGHAINRLATDSFVRSKLEETFIAGTDVPEAFVQDIRAMTFSALQESAAASEEYRKERSLDERLADNGDPLFVVFGAKDNVTDPDSAADYRSVPGAEVQILEGLGHSPQVERPARVAALIDGFAGGGERRR